MFSDCEGESSKVDLSSKITKTTVTIQEATSGTLGHLEIRDIAAQEADGDACKKRKIVKFDVKGIWYIKIRRDKVGEKF